MNNIWIIGCGDVGKRILRRLPSTPAVNAVVRSEASAAACRELGARTLGIDLDAGVAEVGDDYRDARVIYLAPPPPQGTVDTRIRRFLDALGGRTARIVLVSTTGVYGDHAGEWLDEDTPAAPQL